jgi:hypothetical protein
MNKYSLNNIKKITVKTSKIDVEYMDGTKLTITNPKDVVFETNLINDNDQPIIDHCI